MATIWRRYLKLKVAFMLAYSTHTEYAYHINIQYSILQKQLKMTHSCCTYIYLYMTSSQFFAATEALRTIRGSLHACLYVSFSQRQIKLERLIQLLCHLLKKSSGNPNLKICDPIFFCGCPYEKKITNLVYKGVQHFLDNKY